MRLGDLLDDTVSAQEAELPADPGRESANLVLVEAVGVGVEKTAQIAVAATGDGELAS